MKTRIFSTLILLASLVILNSCSRPEMGSGSIRITLPAMPVMSSKSTGSSLIDSIVMKSGDVSAMSTLTLPTVVADINCYMVAVGGPTPDLQRNRVWRQDASQPELKIGDWVGGVPAGGTVEIETSAGSDRVVRLFGLKSNATYCRDFKSPGGYDSNNITNPYLLGEVGGISIDAGATKAVSITRVFDATKYYDKFAGPDFDGAGNNGGGGPYLRLEFQTNGSSGNKYKLTAGNCYQVNAKLYTGSGVSYPNPSSITPVNVTLGSYPFGTFYNTSGCTGGTPTMVSIGTGGSISSSPNFYFRASTSIGDNLQFSNVTLTGDALYILPTFSASNNMIQIGKPTIVFSGPTRVPYGTNAVCVNYDAHLYNFEGGDYTTHTSTLSFNTANNASYYIGGASCANAASIGFAPGVASGTLPFKLQSPGSYDFGAIVTDPSTNFDVVPYVVQSGSGKGFVDAIDLDFMGKPVELGKCASGKIRLVNWDRAMAQATGAIEVYVRTVVQGAGMFYSDGNCSTPAESINFATNDSEKVFSFIPYGSAPSVDLFVSSIKYRLYGIAPGVPSVINIPTPVPSDPWFIRISAPSFSGAKVVGNHEFDVPGSYLYIPFSVGAGFTAMDYSPDGGASWYTIPGAQLASVSATDFIYKWSTADATTNATRTLRVTYPNGTRTARISAQDLYGPSFLFLNCTTTVSSGMTIASLNASYASNSVTCLGPAINFTRGSNSETYQMQTGKSLIGHSSGSSQFSGNGYTGTGLITGPSTSMTAGGAGAFIANVTLSGILGTNAGIFLNGGTGTSAGSSFTISNVTTNLLNNQALNYGIYISGVTATSNLSIKIDRQKAFINGSGAIGLHYVGSNSPLKITGSSYSTQSDQSIGLKVDASSATPGGFTVTGSSFDGNGIGLFATSNSGSYILTPTLFQNGFKITTDYGAGTAGNTRGMLLNGRITGGPQINENVFYSMATPHKALVEISTLSGIVSPMGITMSGNTFIENDPNGYAIYNDSVTGSGVSVTTADYNSFAFLGGAATAATVIRSDSGISYTVTASDSTKVGICSSVTPWSYKINGTGTTGLATFFGTVTPGFGNVSSNSYRCNDP